MNSFARAGLALAIAFQGAPRAEKTPAGPVMVLVPAGAFLMGDGSGAPEEAPVHKVRLDSFWIDAVEVTQENFERMMGYNPAKVVRDRYPVDQIRWLEAIEYANERSRREGKKPCYDLKTGACEFKADGYRLPTEAEWEYACRAGSGSKYFFGEDPSELERFAWYEKNSGGKAHLGAEKKPNAWGLYDMAGGLLEWCNDRYSADYYGKSPAENPAGPEAGKERVLRGGSFRMKASQCRSAARFHDEPANADACFGWDTYGFRCVRRAD